MSPDAVPTTRELVIGTRASALARVQTSIVCDALRGAHPALRLRVEHVRTTGDVRADVPLSQLGRGVFVTELENALRERRIDLAVHSAKDLPSTLAAEFTLAAILPREDARDVLVSPHGSLRRLPAGARVGTSSPRRASEIRALRPDLVTMDVRGNVDTRLRKLGAGEYDALVLAAAGLLRLGRAAEIAEWLDTDVFIPAVGQGALAVEVRRDDQWLVELLRPLDDALSRAAVEAERSFLAELGAGCRAAAGAFARVDASEPTRLRITAFIGDAHGALVRRDRVGVSAHPRRLGVAIAHELLREGGARFLAPRDSALAGKVVAITRPKGQSRELSALLDAHGAIPLLCPTLAIELVESRATIDAALFAPRPPGWIVLTSANAVEAIATYLTVSGRTLPQQLRLAAIGDATATALEDRIRRADFVPSVANAETLAAELPDVAGAVVLFLRGDLAADTLETKLAARGAMVRSVVVYRTTPGPGVGDLGDHVSSGRLDALVFASPSSVHFASPAIDRLKRLANLRPVVVCIGATTARAARAAGLHVVEARLPSVGGIVETLERSFAGRREEALTLTASD